MTCHQTYLIVLQFEFNPALVWREEGKKGGRGKSRGSEMETLWLDLSAAALSEAVWR